MLRTSLTTAGDHLNGAVRRRGLAALFFLAATVLLALCGRAQAETIGGGAISVDTTWAAASSPYHVISGVTVYNGVTLTVEPGVIVYLDPAVNIIVQGTLSVRGTSASPITFTWMGSTEWGYILFDTMSTSATFDVNGDFSGGCILEYCTVQYGGGDGTVTSSKNGTVRVNSVSPYFHYCTVRNSKVRGVCIYQASYGAWPAGTLRMESCTVNDNGGSGISHADAPLAIRDSTFSSNAGNGIYVDDYNNTASHASNIANCIISQNSALGLVLTNSGGANTASKNVIRRNGNGGIYADVNCTIADNVVVNNTFDPNASYVYGRGITGSGGALTIQRNVIADNSTSASKYAGGLYLSGSTVKVVTANAIVRNTASNGAGICYSDYNGSPFYDIRNNLLTGNRCTASSSSATFWTGHEVNFNYNNIFGNTATYAFWNDMTQSMPNQNATDCWWGTATASEIQAQIYDRLVDSDKGLATVAPFSTAIRTDAPISPPLGLIATGSYQTIALSWNANTEGNRAGYKVYWDTQPDFPFANVTDIGNVTSYTLSNLTPANYYVAVTAYTVSYSGAADDPATIINENQTNGNESWFSYYGDSVGTFAAAPQITSATAASGTVGATFSYTITASNNPTSYYATPLPAGLSVNTSTGEITGTPTTAGQASVTISATNTTGTGSTTLTITINLPPVATPTFSPPGGAYSSVQSVTISCATSSATIYYTADGSTPTTSSTPYTAPITVNRTMTIKAFAVKAGLIDSDLASAAYDLPPPAATPTFDPLAGSYLDPQNVALSCSTSGAAMYYTTDGSTPTTSSPQYATPISVTTWTTIKVIAVKAGMLDSDVASAEYRIGPVPQVTSPLAVVTPVVVAGQPVQFSCAADQSELTWAWDFGDGTTATTTTGTATHTFSAAGTFTVVATAATSGGQYVTSTVSVTVKSAGSISNSQVDTDADGFPNELEEALGSSPTDAQSTPFAGAPAGTPLALLIPKMSIKLNFAKTAQDAISFSGTLPVQEGFAVAGQPVAVDVGGVVWSLTLDAKGKSPKSRTESFKLAVKARKKVVYAQNAKYSVKLSKGSFSALLSDEGLVNAAVKDAACSVPVIVLFNQQVFQTDQPQLYSAVAGKSGRTKMPR